MTANRVSGDPLRARLQLAVGSVAELGDRIEAFADAGAAFAAVARGNGQAVIVTLLCPEAAGAHPAAFAARISALRELDHAALELPLAMGVLDGSTWLVQPAVSAPTVAERLATGPLSITEGVSIVRDVTRALAAMHRHGMTHGAVSIDTVRLDGGCVRLVAAGPAHDATVRNDLDALAGFAWAVFTGELEPRPAGRLSSLRRSAPPALDALCAAMLAPTPAHRPQNAEAVLAALDAVPSRRRGALPTMIDAGRSDGRPRRHAPWLVVAAALLLLAMFLGFRS